MHEEKDRFGDFIRLLERAREDEFDPQRAKPGQKKQLTLTKKEKRS